MLRAHFRASGWLIAGTIVSGALSYVSVTISARLLGSADFGLLGAMLGMVSIAGAGLRPVYTMAMHFAAGPEARQDPRVVRALVGPALALSGALGTAALLVLTLGAAPIVDVLQANGLAQIIWLAPFLTALAANQMLAGLLSGLQRFSMLAVIAVIEAFARALLTGPFVLWFGVAGALICYSVGLSLASLTAVRSIGGIGWRVPRMHELSATVSVGAGSLALTLVATLLQNSDLVVLRTYAPVEDVGLYAAAATFGNLLFVFAAPLYLPAFPQTVAAYRAHESTWPILVRVLVPILGIGVAAVVVTLAIGAPLAGLLLGPTFQGTSEIMPAYFGKTTALLLVGAVGQHALAVGRGAYLGIAALVALAGPILLITIHPSVTATAPLMLGVSLLAAGAVAMSFTLPPKKPSWSSTGSR